jgi:transcriptional regulator MraZ
MFRGRYDHRIDEKGRLSLPSRFREILIKQYDENLFLTSSIEQDALRIYPLKAWEEVERKLAELPSHDAVFESLVYQASYYGHECTLDSAGRVLIPQMLRDRVGLQEEVTLIGKLNYIQVWDRKKAIARAAEIDAMGRDLMKAAAKVGF